MMDITNLEELMARDIEALRARFSKMATLVFRQLEDAVSAFADQNRTLAYKVVLRDQPIDVLEGHIDRLCQEFLVRHMPVAHQLRFVVAAVRINSELERIGDYAEAIARRAVTLTDAEQVPEREKIVEMSRHAFQMLRDAVHAFLEDDAEVALRTLDADQQVDDMNSAIFAELARAPTAGADLTMRFALLGVVTRIERVADRACNIAEDAVYVARGEVLRHLPREDNRVLFICDHNSCRSQMAEGIARSMALPSFVFASAGPDPQPLDKKAIEFLAQRGIDISRHRPKRIADVGPIEDFHVVVTLSRGAEEACPKVPYGAVALNWELSDPARTTGSPEEIEAAYAETYERLETKIAEMAEGFAGAFDEETDR